MLKYLFYEILNRSLNTKLVIRLLCSCIQILLFVHLLCLVLEVDPCDQEDQGHDADSHGAEQYQVEDGRVEFPDIILILTSTVAIICVLGQIIHREQDPVAEVSGLAALDGCWYSVWG